jgi:hypothetical protein
MITSSLWLLQLKVNLLVRYISLDLKSPLTSKDLIQFLEADHNILIFGENDAKKPIRGLVNEFGMEIENVVSNTYHKI